MSEPTTPIKPDSAHLWNVLCHASALVGLIIPFGFLLGPFIVWLIKKDEFPSVDSNGKEALNFQLSCLLYGIISGVLVIIAIGFFLLIIIAAADLILVIVASVKISNGENFRYPLTIRFLK